MSNKKLTRAQKDKLLINFIYDQEIDGKDFEESRWYETLVFDAMIPCVPELMNFFERRITKKALGELFATTFVAETRNYGDKLVMDIVKHIMEKGTDEQKSKLELIIKPLMDGDGPNDK